MKTEDRECKLKTKTLTKNLIKQFLVCFLVFCGEVVYDETDIEMIIMRLSNNLILVISLSLICHCFNYPFQVSILIHQTKT